MESSSEDHPVKPHIDDWLLFAIGMMWFFLALFWLASAILLLDQQAWASAICVFLAWSAVGAASWFWRKAIV